MYIFTIKSNISLLQPITSADELLYKPSLNLFFSAENVKHEIHHSHFLVINDQIYV